MVEDVIVLLNPCRPNKCSNEIQSQHLLPRFGQCESIVKESQREVHQCHLFNEYIETFHTLSGRFPLDFSEDHMQNL